MISNRTRAARSFDFEITRMISDQIALHSVQLPLYIDLATAKSEAPIEKLSDFGVKQILYRVDIALYLNPKRCTVKFKSNNGS